MFCWPASVARTAQRSRMIVLAAALGAAVLATPTQAAEKLVVAFGASQTYGKGVAREQAYPAQLEQLLRRKGLDVRVINSGVNGETTGSMLQRLDGSVPAATSVVIFQPGGNDKRKGVGGERAANISAINQRLAERGIAVVMMENKVFRNYPRQADGQHLTAAGYHNLASSLVAKVAALLAP